MKTSEDLNAISHSLEDYISMFALSPSELQMKILNYHAGIDAFGAQMQQQKKIVINIDPLYQYSLDHIKDYKEQAQQTLKQNLKAQPNRYEDLQQIEKLLIQQKQQSFFADFLKGQKENRYLAQALPHLSFEKETFELALVKYFLFTYSKELTLTFHMAALQELLRVANEVRIFPLVTMQSELSPFIGEVIAQLQALNYGTEIKVTPMHLQKNGNALLRVWNPSCSLKMRD